MRTITSTAILAALTFGVFFAGSGAVFAGIIIGNGQPVTRAGAEAPAAAALFSADQSSFNLR